MNVTAQNDTIHINLDSLTIQDSTWSLSYNVKSKACGEGLLSIPLVLKSTGTTRCYQIRSIRGNGDSPVFSKNGQDGLIMPSSQIFSSYWELKENLFSLDCSKNRQELLLRLSYTIHTSGHIPKTYQKRIRIHYNYVQ